MPHTAAPWKLTADPYPDGTPYFTVQAGDPMSDDVATMGFSIRGIMREADARLIAAAPLLLESCAALLTCVDERSNALDIVERAIAAIAAAEGTAP